MDLVQLGEDVRGRPAKGTYDVFVTYPQVDGAASDASFTLTHGDPEAADGAEGAEVVEPAVTVDQSAGAGAWQKVGSYQLTRGEKTSLSLVPSENGTVVADAVKLVRDNSADTDDEQKTFTYSYDVNGNLVSIEDGSSSTDVDAYAVAYDQLNQVESVTENLAGQAKATTQYAYDPNGQPTTVTHPDQVSEYTYDLRDLVKTVSVDDTADDAGAKVTEYTYDARGMRATETKPNGNVVTSAYFADGALKQVREVKEDGSTLVASHTYTYDANGNQAEDVASKMNADDAGSYLDSTTTYTYDPVDRLAKKVKTGNGAATEEYVHDANANVISQTIKGTTTTYVYDRNRLQTATTGGQTANYVYDPFGRQQSATVAGEVISRTTYDGFDHVVKSEKMDDSGALVATTYEFDPLNRTTSTTSGGETTDYSYLGLSSEVLTEQVAGELSKSYQYSPWGQRLSQITHGATAEDADETAYYGYNAHTDVETLTDESGDTVATYGYTAYGADDTSEFTGIDKPDPANPTEAEPYNAYRYNSKRLNAGSGTYDMGFRNYDPGLNRFTTRDMYNGALADMGLGTDPYTANRYAFTAGNPINGIELDGHDFRMEVGSVSGGTTADTSNDGSTSGIGGAIDFVDAWAENLIDDTIDWAKDNPIDAAHMAVETIACSGVDMQSIRICQSSTNTRQMMNVAQNGVDGAIENGIENAITNTIMAASAVPFLRPASAAARPAAGVASGSVSRLAAEAVGDIPTVVFSRSRAPGIARNFDNAVANGAPTRLTRVGDAARKANRRAALRGQGRPAAGQSLDEYPFASTAQGGSGAFVRPVPVGEQSYQGGVLSRFYQNRGVRPGDPFDVMFGP